MSLQETKKKTDEKIISIEIFGLGYVGFPLSVRLASANFNVIGIDVNNERIKRLENNELMDSEIHLKNEYNICRQKNKIKLQIEPEKSAYPKIGIICVPTPIPTKDISSDIFVKAAVNSFLQNAKLGDIIILESSVEVGTTDKIKNIIESKGFEIGKNFGLCFCPERIDPSNKEWGIENIPRVIYCSDELSFEISKKIYQNVNGGNLFKVDNPKIAEVVKSFENAFRLVNISLVNELALLCENLGINVKKVIDAAATKPFGFLPHYPSAGAGGHCIPKDPRFLLESSKKYGLEFQAIENALRINSEMPLHVCNSIEKKLNELKLKKSVIVCGLSYKANVEDMRDSASFKILVELKKRGFDVVGYDPYFKNNLIEKYKIENKLEEFNVKTIEKLDEKIIKQFNCLCIVQHHNIDKNRINEIYNNSTLPYIYDCQNKLEFSSSSNSILESLGS
jgi:UDP-N-acetyl-D-glucosamine dehydrogenase